MPGYQTKVKEVVCFVVKIVFVVVCFCSLNKKSEKKEKKYKKNIYWKKIKKIYQ